MKFLANLFNHNETGQKTLHDVIMILMHQLRALGHTAEWSHGQAIVGDDAINIVVEGFTPSTVPLLAEAHAQGARFLIIATEEPTPQGFNHGGDKEMVARQAILPEAARFADAIWALVPGTAEWYGQFAPATCVELGYAPTLRRTVRQSVPGGFAYPIEPDYEFAFFGAITPRRRKILDRLARLSGKPNAVIGTIFADQEKRDLLVSRAKVVVQIRAQEAMGLVSSSRCNTALHLGRPVIAEPHLLSKPWDQVVHFSRSLEAFYAEALFATKHWQSQHRQQFDRFKALFPPERCVGVALEQTGIVGMRRAA